MVRTLTSRTEDFGRRFRAYVAADDAPRRIYALVADVARLCEGESEATSYIQMNDGMAISVAMDIDALHEKIYGGADDVVDLYPYTEQTPMADMPAMLPQVRNLPVLFNAAAQDADGGMLIEAIARKPYETTRAIVIFNENDVEWATLHEKDAPNSLCGYSVFFNIKADAPWPFEKTNREVMIDGRLDEIHRSYREAQARGDKTLVLNSVNAFKMKLPLKITSFALNIKDGTANYQPFIFLDKEVDWTHAGKYGDTVTRLPLRGNKLSPYGVNYALLDIPHPEFMKIYTQAKMDGVQELDLGARTRGAASVPPRRPGIIS